MASLGTVGVCLLLRVCSVVLVLLLMAGDVERNPGPTEKEGTRICEVVILRNSSSLVETFADRIKRSSLAL